MKKKNNWVRTSEIGKKRIIKLKSQTVRQLLEIIAFILFFKILFWCFVMQVGGKYDMVQLDYTAGTSSSDVTDSSSAPQPSVKQENNVPAPESKVRTHCKH